MIDQRVSLRGETDAGTAANEERRTQRRFQISDALGHARLSKAEFARRRMKAAEAHDAVEGSDLRKREHHRNKLS